MTPEEQKKINDLIKEGIELAKKLGLTAEEASLRNFNGDLVQAERLVKSLKDEWQSVTADIGYAYQGFKKIVSEITKQNVGLKESVKGYNNLSSIAAKIQNHQRGISELSSKEIANLRKKTNEEKIRLENARDILKDEESRLLIERQNLGQKLRAGTISEEERKRLRKIISSLHTVRDTQKEINGLLQDQDELFKGLNLSIDEAERKAKNLEKALGLGGNAVKGLEKTLNSLGLGDLSRSLGIDEVNKKMDETAKKLTDNGDKAATFSTKLRVLGAGMGEMGKQLHKNLFDPLAILGLILKGFTDLNKAATEYGRETGQNVEYMERMNLSGTTMVQQIQQMVSLTQQFGVAADNVFSEDTITEAAEMVHMMGMSNEEAGKLARLSKVNGQELKANNEKIVSTVSNFNKLNKTGIANKTVLKDIANTSSVITMSFKGNTEAMARTAAEARKLGLDLTKVDQIANSLLNFEESIASEFEAELLTGKQINLEQARYYALANDTANLTKEIGNNQDIINAFSSGNRIEQEAITKALGMNRDEMAEMIYQQQIAKGLSEEQAAKMAGVELADMKRLAIQEQINNSIAKMGEALATPLAMLADLLSNAWVLKGILTAIGVIVTTKLVTGLIDVGRTLVTAIPKLITMLTLESGIAVAKISGAIAATGGLGTALILGGIAAGAAALISSVSSAKQTKDGIINPSGGLVISKPEGGVLTPIAQGIPGDYAYLTTNGPQQTQDATITPANKGAIKAPTAASTPQTITIHTHVMLDKKEIASAINQTNLQTEVKTQ
jgi:hypothetical protein